MYYINIEDIAKVKGIVLQRNTRKCAFWSSNDIERQQSHRHASPSFIP